MSELEFHLWILLAIFSGGRGLYYILTTGGGEDDSN